MPAVEIYKEPDLADVQLEAIVRLTNSVWPKEDLTLEQRIEQLKTLVRSPERADINPVRFVVWDGDSAIGHALVFDRAVHVLDANDASVRTINVVALAGVCSDASRRGEGLGLAVVKAAFEQISENRPISLFQTGVPQFYEKLGGRLVSNQFVNLLNTQDPQANPWWDKEVMIVPGQFDWPAENKIDMNGAGY